MVKPKGFDWIDEVLADIQQFCDVNELNGTSVELANARSEFRREHAALRNKEDKCLNGTTETCLPRI